MYSVVYGGRGVVEVTAARAVPTLQDDRDAVVQVAAAGICGTDLHAYRGEIPDFAVGTVLGHEFAGTVVTVGAAVPFAAGERVFASDVIACGRCRRCAEGRHYQCPRVSLFGYSTVVGDYTPGGQAEYVRVPFADTVLARTPHDVSDEQALFVGDVLTTACAAIDDAGVRPGDVVAVLGAGPLGLLVAACAGLAGARAVVVADTDRGRREQVGARGWTAVAPGALDDAVGGLTEGAGADRVVEAVGSDRALARAVQVAAPHATVVVVGAHRTVAPSFPSGRAFARELTVRFTVGDPIRLRHRVMSLIRTGLVDPTTVVTHRLGLGDAAAGYRLMDCREALKVVLRP